VHLEHDVDGLIRQFVTDEQNQRLLVLERNSLIAISTEKGEVTGTVKDLKDPKSVILPKSPQASEASDSNGQE
jgi:hypothetical protein